MATLQAILPPPDAYPKLSVIQGPGFLEYRLATGGCTGVDDYKVDKTIALKGLMILVIPVLQALKISKTKLLLAVGLVTLLLIWKKCTQVVYESIVILPPHGVQLETHRGFHSWAFASRRFLHRDDLRGVFINEGLRTWNVYYYLAFVRVDSKDHCTIDVGFENLLPNYGVLREVYNSVQELLQ